MNKKFQQLNSLINTYLNNHLQAFRESRSKMKNEKIANLLTTSIITLTLTIPVIFYLCILNIQTLTTTWQTNSSQISLYLKPSLNEIKIQNFLTNLRKDPNFTAIKYISPHEGLQNFAQALENSRIITVLKNNPLPPLIVIQPKNKLTNLEGLNQLLNHLRSLPEVDTAKLDMQWLERLSAILILVKKLTLTFAILFGLGIILIINHAVNTATRNEQHEITVWQQLGATKAFIRRPFLYVGAWYGILGGFCSWLLTNGLIIILRPYVTYLNTLYASNFKMISLNFSYSLLLIITSTLLGIIGSWLATMHKTSSTHARASGN